MPKIQITPETPLSTPLAPAGVPLTFEITRVEEKAPKNGGAMMLEITHKVIAPGEAYDGDLVFDYATKYQSDLRTQAKLARLAKCLGLTLTADGLDSEAFIGRQGKFVLKVRPASEQYEEGRQLKDYVI